MALSGSDHGRPVRGKTTRIHRPGKKSSTRIPTVKHEAQIRSITPADDSKPLHERVASNVPAKIGGTEAEAPRGKTTRSISRRTSSDSQRTKRGAIPVKQSNPLPIILGAGGGALLLIIIVIAAASSGGKPVKPPKPVVQAPPPPVVVEKPKDDLPATGYVTFVCDGNGSHEEEEAIWGRRCPSCNGRAPFYWDDAGAKFKCWDCKKLFTKSDVKCPKCDKVSFNPRVKPRPRGR